MIERPDVATLMKSGLGDWLAGQQQLRDATAAKSQKITWVSLGIAGVVALAIIVLFRSIEVAGFAAIAIAGAGWAWAHSVRAPVIASIKQAMNAKIAGALGCEFTATVVEGPEFQLAVDHDLLPAHDRKDFADAWRGLIGEMPFLLYEAHLQEWRQSGKNRRLETVFRGCIVTIGFARRFHGVTLVERQGGHMTFFGLRDSIEVGGVKLSMVKMSDPRFEDDFTIWSSDTVEAHYLVHPAYVQRLIELESKFEGKKIRTLFHGGSLIIIIETDENMFESGSLDAGQDRGLMAETIGQFVTLATLATELNERPRG